MHRSSYQFESTVYASNRLRKAPLAHKLRYVSRGKFAGHSAAHMYATHTISIFITLNHQPDWSGSFPLRATCVGPCDCVDGLGRSAKNVLLLVTARHVLKGSSVKHTEADTLVGRDVLPYWFESSAEPISLDERGPRKFWALHSYAYERRRFWFIYGLTCQGKVPSAVTVDMQSCYASSAISATIQHGPPRSTPPCQQRPFPLWRPGPRYH